MEHLRKFIEPIFFILGGIAFIIFTRNSEPYSPSTTNQINGILSDLPKISSNGKGQNELGLWLVGHKNLYEFSNCSYNERIAEKVYLLKPGDSVLLYVKKKSFSYSFPWKGENYQRFQICAASSSKVGYIIKFEQFNKCDDYQVNRLIPIVSGIFIVMGFFSLFRKLKDNKNIEDINNMETIILDFDSENDIFIKPDRIAYHLKHIFFLTFPIIAGILIIYQADLNLIDIIGFVFILIGLYILFHYFLTINKISYKIDSEGITLTRTTYFFQNKNDFIKYNTILEVLYRQDLYEIKKNLGTILIYTGKKNGSQKFYSRIIGVENYKQLSKLILEKTNIKD
jgi:hypothetical protein